MHKQTPPAHQSQYITERLLTTLLTASSAHAAGAGFKYYAKGHLVFLLIRQFKLLFQDLSVCVELDQAVDLDSGERSTAMQ